MTYDSWKARNRDDEIMDTIDDSWWDDGSDPGKQLLIGPLAHIKHRSAFGFDYFTVDFSRPGALERYAAEEGEWWSMNRDKEGVR